MQKRIKSSAGHIGCSAISMQPSSNRAPLVVDLLSQLPRDGLSQAGQTSILEIHRRTDAPTLSSPRAPFANAVSLDLTNIKRDATDISASALPS
jgi:hypothetical protein